MHVVLMRGVMAGCCACVWANAAPAAEPALTAARLGLQARRADAVRTVRTLQIAYSQFAEFGLWDEMAALFAPDATIIDGDRAFTGLAAIGRHLRDDLGGGQMGLPLGALHTELYMSPVVTISADGRTAQARWQVLSLLGDGHGGARWAGGMEEDGYAWQGGVWKIARIHYYPQLAGAYETGFFAVTPTLPFIAYHYTPEQAGTPVPPVPVGMAAPPARLDAVERQIAAMADEDSIRNLQNSYGYYVDRKMWDDVTDLFATDGVLEIAGVGVYDGPAGVRRALERDGPAGLQAGQVNDHIQMNMIITVASDGTEAQARGLELGMLGPKLGQAAWSVSIFVNRYAKQGGVWRIREMRIYPRMKADYYQGWGKSSIIDGAAAAPDAPDHASAAADAPQRSLAVPDFTFANPATRRAVRIPAGRRIVGAERLRPALAADGTRPRGTDQQRLAASALVLARSQARDAVENISSAYGFYLDDFQWQPYVELYTQNGRREKTCCGFYIGRDHIFRAEALSYGPMPVPRDWIRLHTRLQPVIDVAADAKSAYLRTRMLLYFANRQKAGAWNSGMYPNESAVVENGVWKMNVGGGIDEPYFMSPSYQLGWAKPPAGADAAAALAASGPLAARGAAAPPRRIEFPPDIAISALGARGEGFARGLPNYISWPQIKPMWFAYRNPVSGRVPPHYCPDITTCVQPAAHHPATR